METSKGTYIVEPREPDGLDGDNDVRNALPSHLGAFNLTNSQRIMNNFIRERIGFCNDSIYYGDTDSLYRGNKYWEVSDKANLVGEHLCQAKNDYESGGILYGLFLALKIKYCLTNNDFGSIQQHMTFKGFNDNKHLLDQFQFSNMLEGKNISVLLTRS